MGFSSFKARDPYTTRLHTRGQSLGLAFDGLAGLLSALAAAVVIVLIIRRIRQESEWPRWGALDVSIIGLFCAEFVQGIGHVLDLKWFIEGKAYTGTFCSAQGVLRQLGDTCAAFATLTIAVQTFLTIWWLKYLSRTTSVVVISVEFSFVILFVGIAYGKHTHAPEEYYAAPIPYWCWIGDKFLGERIGGEYLWFWLTLLVSLATYIPLFLLHRKIIKPGTRWYSPSAEPEVRKGHGDGEDQSDVASSDVGIVIRRDAKLWSTILYPILYCVLIMPLSVVRWIGFKNGGSSPVATFAVMITLSLGGILNALLYRFTRARFFYPDERRCVEMCDRATQVA